MRKMIARLLVLTMLLAFIPIGTKEAWAVPVPPEPSEETTIFVTNEDDPIPEGYVRYVFDSKGKFKLTYLPDPDLAKNVGKIIVDKKAGEPFGKTEELIGAFSEYGYLPSITINGNWYAPKSTDVIPEKDVGKTIVYRTALQNVLVTNFPAFANHPFSISMTSQDSGGSSASGYDETETAVLDDEDYLAHGFDPVKLTYLGDLGTAGGFLKCRLTLKGMPKLLDETYASETTTPFNFLAVDRANNRAAYLYTFTIYPQAYVENPTAEDNVPANAFATITFKAGKHGTLNSTLENSTLENQDEIVYAAGIYTISTDLPIPEIVPNKGYEVAEKAWADEELPKKSYVVSNKTHTAQYVPAKVVIDEAFVGNDHIIITPPPIDNIDHVTVTLPDDTTITITKDESGNWIDGDSNAFDTNEDGGIIVPVDKDIMEEDSSISATVTDGDGTTSKKNTVTVTSSEADAYDTTGTVSVKQGRKIAINDIALENPLPAGATIIEYAEVDTNVVKTHETTMTIEFKDGSQKEYPLLVVVKKKGSSAPPVIVNPAEPTEPEEPTPPVDPEAPNKDDLKDAADELEDLLNNDTAYTDSSEDAASDVLDKAKEVIKNDKASQDDINDAFAKVKDAIKGLVVAVNLDSINHWAYMFGYPDGSFKASRNMTRAEVASMFSRLYNQPVQDIWAINKFKDGQGNHWYSEPVNRMIVAGILGGYKDNTIRPNAPVSRAEFTAMAVRFAQIDKNLKGKTFTDVPANHWAAGDIRQATAVGWMSGRTKTTFAPNAHITRAEAVTIVNAMLNRSFDAHYGNASTLNQFNDLSAQHWAFENILEATIGHDYERHDDLHHEKWTAENHKHF